MIRKLLWALVLLGMSSANVCGAEGVHTAAAVAAVRSGATVLDVRSAEEFASGHLPQALAIPHDQLAHRLPELKLSKERPIVVYCRSGKRAEIARQVLESAGYTNVVNGGGYQELVGALSQP